MTFYFIVMIFPNHNYEIFNTKKHIKTLLEVTEEDSKLIAKIYMTINKIAKDLGIEKDGFRVVANCGRDSGQEVMHIHFHMLAGKKLEPK